MAKQMESGTNKKIKVAWICHFSDEFIQERLPLWKKSSPFGAWIRNTLEGFKDSKEFEIHVIAPHQYLKKNFSFVEDGIHFHFFKTGIPFINRSWPSFFDLDLLSNFYMNRLRIGKIIDKIKPDLINLHGAENAYYSSSVLDLYEKYPLLISIQGFICLENSAETLSKNKRIEIESQIIKKMNYFIGEEDSRSVIRKIRNNNDFCYFNFYYPNGSNIDELETQNNYKQYDLLFWSRIIKDKGAEDFILLVAAVKAKVPQIKASFIGPVSKEYLEYLKNKAKELGCFENINFIGFINDKIDLYKEILKYKILVIPTYNDRFPTVLREAVCLKIAVVSYPTGSIPQFNIGDERILLSEAGNINDLFNNTMKLIEDEVFFDKIIQKAYTHGRLEFSIENNCKKLRESYKSILNI